MDEQYGVDEPKHHDQIHIIVWKYVQKYMIYEESTQNTYVHINLIVVSSHSI